MLSDYIILEAHSSLEMVDMVKDKLLEGYNLQGGISMTNIVHISGDVALDKDTGIGAVVTVQILFAQAMTKGVDLADPTTGRPVPDDG